MIPGETLIFGAGLHAQKLAKAYQEHNTKVLAFVVSKKNDIDNIDGISVNTWEDVWSKYDKNTSVSCGVFNRRDDYEGLAGLFAEKGVNNIIWPWEYYPVLEKAWVGVTGSTQIRNH